MTKDSRSEKRIKKARLKKMVMIFTVEILVLLILFGSYRLYVNMNKGKQGTPTSQGDGNDQTGGKTDSGGQDKGPKLSKEEQEALALQEKLKKETQEREVLISQADELALGYDYDGAIQLIKSYQGTDGDYQVYPALVQAIQRLETEQGELLLYGGSYTSVTQVNHIFFHSLVADNSKAFDGDYMSTGYNMYMTTISEFKKMIEKLYEDGYVLVRMADLTKKVTLEDGTTKYVENEIYLREGKKPLIISQDDVNYYDYMKEDGFARRIVIGEDGKPTCEMVQDDGTIITGAFDMVPILDEFVEEHPDFSYKGAKGLLAITGYEGTLGYRTNDPNSPTYEEDKETVKKVAEALKADGWEIGSHSWGHKNMQTSSFELLKRDTNRWLEEVGSLVGPTDIYIFPYGADIETTIGTYSSDKYNFLKECGFNVFCGVYKEPWMHVKKDYVRMTRRPLDGQAMLEFPERLADLFDVKEIIDPERPAKDW